MLYIGIMSGTSMDGIDALIVDLQDALPKILAHRHTPYPDEVKLQLLDLIKRKNADLEVLGALHTHLGELYADSVKQLLLAAGISADQIKAIGLHGQTIFHAPDTPHPFTWQLGNAHVVAATTNIPVIADFRGLDVALGGQGAPLAPIFHLALFGALANKVAVLNLGGIANLTLIEQKEMILAFDTGPANCLIDAWMQETQQKAYDPDGQFARTGEIIPQLLASLLKEPYLRKSPPKSTGRELFNLAWLRPHLKESNSAQDVARTLTEFTAMTITEALQQNQFTPDILIVCGGGLYNQFLLERLQNLALCLVKTSMDYGFKAETIEAMAFAYLAQLFMEHKKVPLKKVTGAQQNHLCGVAYLPAE